MSLFRNERPIAWVLNLDAENELEAGPGYAPTRHLKEIVARESQHLLGTLALPGDRVLTPGEIRAGEAEGFDGRAWSPTPRALRALELAGARCAEAPTVEVLAEVNRRPFASGVRAELRRGSFAKHVASTLDEALEFIARPAPLGWLVRRSFGAAGRGRSRIPGGRPTDAEHSWLVASLRKGPLVIEPFVEITREYTRSGWVARNGDVIVSPPCFQEVTKSGAWSRTEAAGAREVAAADDERLEEACAKAGAALRAAGYCGPYGIDAFRYRSGPGAKELLNPLSEINARFTMDWTTGMTRRPEREVSS